MKEKEAELKSAEQRLHEEFERLRRQNQEEKRQQDDKKRQLVSESLWQFTHKPLFAQVRISVLIAAHPQQEEEISLFTKKKAAVQAQRAQSEREAMAKKGKK